MSLPLTIENLTVHYQKKPALWGVDLKLEAGQIVGIIGPNGAGKSTLIKAVMDLLPLSSGVIKVFDKSFSKNRKRIGYMPQRESIDWDFPVNVFDVVLMGRYGHLKWFQRPRSEDIEKTWSCIEKVKLTPFANRQISNLSGGQQQRVFLARALAQESDLYLMDEPFAAIDSATETATIELFRELKEQGKTIIVVHHDLATARRYFDSLLLLNKQVVAFGPTQEVFTGDRLQQTYGGKLTILEDQSIAASAEPSIG